MSTTVDYVVGNSALANILSSCSTLNDHPFNISDHFSITLKVDLSLTNSSQSSPPVPKVLNWELSLNVGSVFTYSSLSDDLVKSLMDKEYSCIEELDKDISLVCKSLADIASSSIHTHKTNSLKDSRISDSFLSTLCWKSRVAHRKWKAAGCPRIRSCWNCRKSLVVSV